MAGVYGKEAGRSASQVAMTLEKRWLFGCGDCGLSES